MLHFSGDILLFSWIQTCLIKNTSWILRNFLVASVVALSIFIFYLKYFSIFPLNFLCMQIKLKLFSPDIVSALENKKLLSYFRVYRKSSTSAQSDGWITTDRLWYSGPWKYNFCIDNHFENWLEWFEAASQKVFWEVDVSKMLRNVF